MTFCTNFKIPKFDSDWAQFHVFYSKLFYFHCIFHICTDFSAVSINNFQSGVCSTSVTSKRYTWMLQFIESALLGVSSSLKVVALFIQFSRGSRGLQTANILHLKHGLVDHLQRLHFQLNFPLLTRAVVYFEKNCNFRKYIKTRQKTSLFFQYKYVKILHLRK